MGVDSAKRLGGIGDGRPEPAIAGDNPGITHLAAAFAIKRRLIDHNLDGIARRRAIHALTVLHQRDDLRLAVAGEIAGEFRRRSEEHTSELQSLMRISYAVFYLKINNNKSQLEQQNKQTN